MDLVLCHTTADFDTLGAAVGITLLYPGSRIVLTAGCHPTVQRFLALHRDEYPLVERRAVDIQSIQSLAIVDTQSLERLGPSADWVEAVAQRGGEITIFDHHEQQDSSIPATRYELDSVGAATTQVVERLRARAVPLTWAQATVMALGIHVDTGSLTFTSSTPRDAAALAWLMEQGAKQVAIAEYVEPSLSPELQDLLAVAMAEFQRERRSGHSAGWVLLTTDGYVPGLSGLAERLISLMDVDSLLLGCQSAVEADTSKLVLIGRAKGRATAHGDRHGVDFNQLLAPLGGGGHPAAASATTSTDAPEEIFLQVLSALLEQIPPDPTARDLMSSPVRTIRPDTTITEAQRLLLRYGHSGLSVVDEADQLVGIISRRDVDLALHHEFGHAPVKGYMTTQVRTVEPTTSLADIETLMMTYDIGRLPVLKNDQLVGVVTRTDVLRQHHQAQLEEAEADQASPLPIAKPPLPSQLWQDLQQRLSPTLWSMLQRMAEVARDREWQLYLVGGGVRDLFLTPDSEPLSLQDIDLVVDSAAQTLEMGAGVVLAEAVQAQYPQVDLQVYGRFQTAALVWHEDSEQDKAAPVMVDIATARTEFYPYPAANPEVEASSIRQDLYRRDFTINALAIALTPPRPGHLLDFFGGLEDLRQHYVRVLHANSFIEDPTRIFRAVRFAVRLDFVLEPQTEGFIRYAIGSGVYKRLQAEISTLPALQTRLKAELKYILEALYWEPALRLLDDLGALVCLHPDLRMNARIWQQMGRISRWMSRVQDLPPLTPWLTRLELLITVVPASARQWVAENLQLPASSIKRLSEFGTAEQAVLAELPACDRPSQYVQHLRQYDTETLILISVRSPQAVGGPIWRYLIHWSQITAPLDGHDLRALGYAPGPNYRTMLEALLAATLDGVVSDRERAIAFLEQQFPRQP